MLRGSYTLGSPGSLGACSLGAYSLGPTVSLHFLGPRDALTGLGAYSLGACSLTPGPQSEDLPSGGLPSGVLQSHATDFGSRDAPHWTGSRSLGAYLGAYSLGPTVPCYQFWT